MHILHNKQIENNLWNSLRKCENVYEKKKKQLLNKTLKRVLLIYLKFHKFEFKIGNSNQICRVSDGGSQNSQVNYYNKAKIM